MKNLTASILIFVLLPLVTYGWSAPGHSAIGRAALSMISPALREKVEQILESEDIDEAAIWFDHVRQQARKQFHFEDQKEQDASVKFNHDFKKNSEWHFVNYPVGLTKYQLEGKFSSSDDVVHGIRRAIAVLEGTPSKMSKQQALRLLIHLVGDIHQPLHCVTGFYDISDKSHPVILKASEVKDPEDTTEDRGGNQIFFTKTQQLHEMWDKTIPAGIAKEPADLASAITVSNFKSQPKTAGDYHDWAEIWAGESMVEGKAAYKGLVFNSITFETDPQHPDAKPSLHIHTDLPGGSKGYKASNLDRTKQQLSRAAVHLAQVLEKIKFE